jgi:hypothetical protein
MFALKKLIRRFKIALNVILIAIVVLIVKQTAHPALSQAKFFT